MKKLKLSVMLWDMLLQVYVDIYIIYITIHIKLKGHRASQMPILEKGLVQLLLTMWIVQQQ